MALSPVLLPFYGQFAAGYKPAPAASASISTSVVGTSSSGGAASASSNPTDVIDIRSSSRSGTFTAAAGDLFSLGDLYTPAAPTGSSIANYKVALRRDPGAPNDGQRLLGDKDVTGQLSFTADEFSRLHFKVGASGSQQDLVVLAQLGTRLANGTLSNVIDSPAVQITANVTGTRSINAAGALLTQARGADAGFVNIAQEASIFTGFGQARPGLSTVGLSYNPQSAADLLLDPAGNFQSTERVSNTTASTTYQVHPQYLGDVGASQTGGLAKTGGAQGAAPWTLSNSDLGGYRTRGSNLTLQRFAVATYQASSLSG